MNKLEEFSWRVAEDTEFAATLTCIPFDEYDECYSNQWQGRIKFDNDAYNFPEEVGTYEDGKPFIMVNDWQYPGIKSGGTHLMNLLMNWHGQIVALFKRIRSTAHASK